MQHLWQGNHMTLRDPRNRQASSKMDPKDIRLFVFLRRIWWQSIEGTSGSSSQPHAPRSKTNILAIQLTFLLLDHNLNYPIYSNLHSATWLMTHAIWHMTHDTLSCAQVSCIHLLISSHAWLYPRTFCLLHVPPSISCSVLVALSVSGEGLNSFLSEATE